MYLIIREDSQCAERTPLWGEPSIERYVERLRQNLDALSAHATLKFGYEWSALELELLARNAPDVLQKMCSLMRMGRIAFYNGAYSQPHLQVLSAEANIRQFEYGMRIHNESCARPVCIYAHQEAEHFL